MRAGAQHPFVVGGAGWRLPLAHCGKQGKSVIADALGKHMPPQGGQAGLRRLDDGDPAALAGVIRQLQVRPERGPAIT